MSDQDRANNAAERFTMPRKEFIQPSKPLVTPTLRRENAPAIPLSQLPPLRALNLPTFGTPVPNKPRERKERTSTKVEKEPVYSGPLVVWGPEHVCSDRDFILRTRKLSIHDEECKKLFFANGGEEIVDDYSTLAQAFDALRRTKSVKLAGQLNGITAETPLRAKVDPINTETHRVYVPGLHADAQRVRDRARQDADRRRENEEWINGGKTG